MLLSWHQNAGQHREIKIANRSFENVSQLKYLGTTVTNRNLIQELIKRRLSFGNACHHSDQNLLSSSLLSKNLKMRIYETHFACGLLLSFCSTTRSFSTWPHVGRHLLLSFCSTTRSFSTWPHDWAPLITVLPGGGFTLTCFLLLVALSHEQTSGFS
jgi:hypothetical protein